MTNQERTDELTLQVMLEECIATGAQLAADELALANAAVAHKQARSRLFAEIARQIEAAKERA